MRALALALALGLAGSALAEGHVPHSLETWDNAARLGLPIWLKGWLGFLAAENHAPLILDFDEE